MLMDGQWTVLVPGLLARLPRVPHWDGGRGYTSHAFREHIRNWDSHHPMIPPQRHEAPVACPAWIYHNTTGSSACGRGARSSSGGQSRSLPASRLQGGAGVKTAASSMGVLCTLPQSTGSRMGEP